MIKAIHPSPIGPLTIVSDGGALTALVFDNHLKDIAPVAAAVKGEDELTQAARTQLDEYFAGARAAFDLPLAPIGPPFRQRVWAQLTKLRFGETISYSGIAASLKNSAPRAVGGAVGANPISIIIPCHRVVGKDGSLTGFAGGLERKQFLLALEQGHARLAS